MYACAQEHEQWRCPFCDADLLRTLQKEWHAKAAREAVAREASVTGAEAMSEAEEEYLPESDAGASSDEASSAISEPSSERESGKLRKKRKPSKRPAAGRSATVAQAAETKRAARRPARPPLLLEGEDAEVRSSRAFELRFLFVFLRLLFFWS